MYNFRFALALAIIMPIVALAIGFGGELWVDSTMHTLKSASEGIVYKPVLGN